MLLFIMHFQLLLSCLTSVYSYFSLRLKITTYMDLEMDRVFCHLNRLFSLFIHLIPNQLQNLKFNGKLLINIWDNDIWITLHSNMLDILLLRYVIVINGKKYDLCLIGKYYVSRNILISKFIAKWRGKHLFSQFLVLFAALLNWR
jgi:hypothetical protein